jgi:hypothetical protein
MMKWALLRLSAERVIPPCTSGNIEAALVGAAERIHDGAAAKARAA